MRRVLFIAILGAGCAKSGGGNDVAPAPTPAARFAEWRGADLGAFALDHVVLEASAIRLSPSGGLDGTDSDGRYDGATFTYGTLVSPEIAVVTPFREAIASWEAATPPDTWIEVSAGRKNGCSASGARPTAPSIARVSTARPTPTATSTPTRSR